MHMQQGRIVARTKKRLGSLGDDFRLLLISSRAFLAGQCRSIPLRILSLLPPGLPSGRQVPRTDVAPPCPLMPASNGTGWQLRLQVQVLSLPCPLCTCSGPAPIGSGGCPCLHLALFPCSLAEHLCQAHSRLSHTTTLSSHQCLLEAHSVSIALPSLCATRPPQISQASPPTSHRRYLVWHKGSIQKGPT